MTYTAFEGDDSTPVDSRVYPTQMTCHKLSTSSTAAYKLLPRDVKSVALYCTVATWVRVDKVTTDSSSAESLSDTSKDNVIYVPAGSFVIAQNTEFNKISAKLASSTDTLYIYPGYGGTTTGLVAESLLS